VLPGEVLVKKTPDLRDGTLGAVSDTTRMFERDGSLTLDEGVEGL
jgi:hypothetical protein